MHDQELWKEIHALRKDINRLANEQRRLREDIQKILDGFELMRLERMGIAGPDDYDTLGGGTP